MQQCCVKIASKEIKALLSVFKSYLKLKNIIHGAS